MFAIVNKKEISTNEHKSIHFSRQSSFLTGVKCKNDKTIFSVIKVYLEY